MITTTEIVRTAAKGVQKIGMMLSECPVRTAAAASDSRAVQHIMLILLAYLFGSGNTDDITDETLKTIMSIFVFRFHADTVLSFKTHPKSRMLADITKALMTELFTHVLPALTDEQTELPASACFTLCSNLITAYCVAFKEYNIMNTKMNMAGLLSNLLKKQDKRIVPQMLIDSYAELQTEGLVDAFETEFADLVYDSKMHGIYPK